MLVKVGELSGVALDWAAAKAAEVAIIMLDADNPDGKWQTQRAEYPHGPWWPSQDWSQGGPLIEKFRLHVFHHQDSAQSEARGQSVHSYVGDTTLISAMRAIVAAKFGDEVDVPEGLV